MAFLLAIVNNNLPAADRPRISVSDFHVASGNPDYKYLGKGFAEFISINLAASSQVDLIVREKRLEALQELALSQSGAVDESAQLSVGKILTARYILYGNIFDIGGQFSVTFKIIDTETGKVIAQDKVSARLANYDYIAAIISQKVLQRLGVDVPAEVIRIAGNPVDKAEKAAVSFSNAVSAYDAKDIAQAKKQLDVANALDPGNAAVNAYLQKLVVNTAKFKILTEEVYPNQNPAFLGIMQYDRLFLSTSFINMQENRTALDAFPGIEDVEQDIRFNAGYQFPLSKSLGMSIEGIFFHYKDELNRPATSSQNQMLTNPDGYGGILSFGWALNEYFAIGGSAAVFQYIRKTALPGVSTNGGGDPTIRNTTETTNGGFSAGFLIKNPANTIIFDTMAGYATQKSLLLDPVTYNLGKQINAPIYNESTFTIAFFQKRLYMALKQVSNFYTDRDYFVARVIPSVEIWIITAFALRAGGEINYFNMEGTQFTGAGVTGGFSLRSMSLGVDIDFNMTSRKRPSRIVTAQTINETIFFFGASKTNLALAR